MTQEFRPLVRFVSRRRSQFSSFPTSESFILTTIITPAFEDLLDPEQPIERSTTDAHETNWNSFITQYVETNEKKTAPVGFFDSIFTSESTDDTQMRVAAITLWIVTFLLVVLAIGWLFKLKKTNFRLILIHILFYEFFYLFYILLSMINVALDFRLNGYLCDLANYGMYFTIPLMHFAVIFLSIQRLTEHVKADATWVKMCSNAIIIQIILIALWLIFAAAMFSLILFKRNHLQLLLTTSVSSISPDLAEGMSTVFGLKADQCSIDGRPSPIFKILLFVLFAALLVVMVKALVTSILFGTFNHMLRALKNRNKDEDQDEDKPKYRPTLAFILIVLCNLIFSYPFYIISIFSFIFTNIEATKTTFTTTLKGSFLVRIVSILLQALVVLHVEKNSAAWAFRKIRARIGNKSGDTDVDSETPKTTRTRSSRTVEPAEVEQSREEASSSSDEDQSTLLETKEMTKPEQRNGRILKPQQSELFRMGRRSIYATIDERPKTVRVQSLPPVAVEKPSSSSSASSSSASSSESEQDPTPPRTRRVRLARVARVVTQDPTSDSESDE